MCSLVFLFLTKRILYSSMALVRVFFRKGHRLVPTVLLLLESLFSPPDISTQRRLLLLMFVSLSLSLSVSLCFSLSLSLCLSVSLFPFLFRLFTHSLARPLAYSQSHSRTPTVEINHPCQDNLSFFSNSIGSVADWFFCHVQNWLTLCTRETHSCVCK